MEKLCTECQKDMSKKWPLIVDKLQVCPTCSSAKARPLKYINISKSALNKIA